LYSVHDARVIGRFHEQFADSDPVLEEAFDLFTWARYGSSVSALCRNGISFSPDCIFVGHESQPDIAEFIRFFESRLLSVAKAASHVGGQQADN
jgi:hypothetical protein